MMTNKLLACAVLTALSLATSIARAETPAEDVETQWREGVARYEKKDYEGARPFFQRAYAATKEARYLLNLALAELRSGHSLEALRHLKLYAKAPDANAAKVEQVTKVLIPQAYKETGHIAVETSAGAQILVDGVAVAGRAPLEESLDVSVGKHTIEIRLGGRTGRVEVDAEAGSEVLARPELPAEQPTPTPAAATQPAVAAAEAPRSGSFWSTRNVVVLGLAAGALGAGGAGLAFRFSASSDDDKARDARAITGSGENACVGVQTSACADLKSATDASSRDANLSTAFFIGGGVLAATAIVALIVWPSGPKRSTAARTLVVPSFGRGGPSLGLVHAF